MWHVASSAGDNWAVFGVVACVLLCAVRGTRLFRISILSSEVAAANVIYKLFIVYCFCSVGLRWLGD